MMQSSSSLKQPADDTGSEEFSKRSLSAPRPPMIPPSPVITQRCRKYGSSGRLSLGPMERRASLKSAKMYKNNASTRSGFIPEQLAVRDRTATKGHEVISVTETSTTEEFMDLEQPSQVLQHTIVNADDDETNSPHPMLEYPVLYYLLRTVCPALLNTVKCLYNVRWSFSYPLQRRLPFAKTLRKIRMAYTWSELFLVIPFFVCIVSGAIYSFVWPSVSISGHACRTPLIFAFVMAMHNSFLTLLIGLPFERAIRYHKLAAKLAYFNSILHTYVAFRFPDDEESPNHFGNFLMYDKVNIGGTVLVACMTAIIITAMPQIRRKVFEMFYYIHFAMCAGMVCGAFYHTGFLVPSLAALSWGVDLVVRKVLMARLWHPKEAKLALISSTVVELSFRKTRDFDFNPGQYIFICIPEISFWQWHPFSLSSSPEQELVTLHIRKAGWWTSTLHELAKTKVTVRIRFEGPYGSVGVDLQSKRYGMVMLFSGGIGVTPMQSISNQLMYEHHLGKRQLKKLSFVWVERDPQVFQEVDVVRRSGAAYPIETFEDPNGESMAESMKQLSHAGSIASVLLSAVPQSRVSDSQLEAQYPSTDFDGDLEETTGSISLDLENGKQPDLQISSEVKGTGKEESKPRNRRDELAASKKSRQMESATVRYLEACNEEENCDVLKKAYGAENEPLDLQVYLTAKDAPAGMPPFVYYGRPDIKRIIEELREEAICAGERRVAVCVCAPKRLVDLCSNACAKYSDSAVAFDFHSEVFE